MAAAGSEIERRGLAAFFKIAQRRDMSVCQVADMDVVANGGAVRRRIVGTENVDRVDLSVRRHERTRNKMRLRFVHLADFARRRTPARVEIAQRHRAQAV